MKSPKQCTKSELNILDKLSVLYPEPKSELSFKNPYQLICAVLLSAQCTDKKVNEVTPLLFEDYPDYQTLARAQVDAVEKIIRPVNYYRTKAKHLVAMANLVMTQFDGQLPQTLEDLQMLPGVGRKTASVVLGELGLAYTFPVDTHVFRVSQRLGFAQGDTVEEIEQQLRKKFPETLWRNLHHWLILHGRRVCKAQRPLCSECAIAASCAYFKP